MFGIPVLVWFVLVVVAALAVTQVVIPLVRKTPLFPLFRGWVEVSGSLVIETSPPEQNKVVEQKSKPRPKATKPSNTTKKVSTAVNEKPSGPTVTVPKAKPRQKTAKAPTAPTAPKTENK